MKIKTYLAKQSVLAPLIGVLLLLGCGGTATPTATPIPPTATPQPTPLPTSAGAIGDTGTLAGALNKVKTAESYRVRLSASGRGSFATGTSATSGSGAAGGSETLISMQGEVNGKNARFVLQGLLTGFLGIEPTRPLEVVSYDGSAYLKGPVPLVGATLDKWYQLPPQVAQLAQPPLTPGSVLESFGDAGIEPAEFTKSGSESLDGIRCDVYIGGKSTIVSAFRKLSGAAGAMQDDLDTIDNAEFKFWVCPDGYLHQGKMLIEGHEMDKPEQKGTFEILLRLSDFDGDVQILPPADAIPLQPRQFGPTSTR